MLPEEEVSRVQKSLRVTLNNLNCVVPEYRSQVMQSLYTHCTRILKSESRNKGAGKALTHFSQLASLPIERATVTEESITPKQFLEVLASLKTYTDFIYAIRPKIVKQETSAVFDQEKEIEASLAPDQQAQLEAIAKSELLEGLSNRGGDCYFNCALQAFNPDISY